ncbi:TPA: hypothetical protein SAO08_003144 [Burkholderia multivorans]|nr:hypothetical protein [Burkholderia multivorans]
MDRQIVYAGQIPLETDLLYTNRNAYTALGMLIQDMFGTNTVFSGLGCVPTSPAGMTVNVNPGRVYSLQQRDPTAYSSLGQDTTNQIMKQGVLLSATNFSCPAPATSGYSINYLISASFLEQDTNAVVLPYYNSANPSQAFSGPPVNGQSSGIAQNTTRQDTIQLTLTAGVAAATGSQQTPATPTGQIPLWVITVAYGQTSITASSIAAVAGSPFAPTGGYFQAVGERYSSIINASASQTLTTAALGALVNVTATGTTQTLPAASACPNGTSITIVYMQSSGSATVARNGTDTLSFGQGSSTNSITLNPGEEVQFVSNGTNGWVSAGQTLSTGVTPPTYDNSTKLATMAALSAAGVRFSSFGSISGTYSLALTDLPKIIAVQANGQTITLPPVTDQHIGAVQRLFIYPGSSNTVTVQGSGVQQVSTPTTLGSSVVVSANGFTDFIWEGTATQHWEVSGAGVMDKIPAFASSLASSGYQKLPSGLLIQWGITAGIPAASTGTTTFPIAFPTALRSVVATYSNSSNTTTPSGGSPFQIGASSATSFNLYNGGSASSSYMWIAIGY